MDIVELPLQLIDEDTTQPRYQFDEDALQELKNSIEELGLLSPIKVRRIAGGRYKIIYGNRRYKASLDLGRATIPCIVSDVTDELEIYLEQVAENLTREGFTPIEEAEAFDKLMHDPRFSSSTKFLSSKLGKPENYIKNKLELLKFDARVRKLIVAGTEIRKDKLTEDQLLPLRDMPIEYRDTLALIVARDELPVSDVKRLAKLFKDKDLSAGTKDKLLYKSGYELMQTWSTLEANRAERARRAEQQEESGNAGKSRGTSKAAAKETAPPAQSNDASSEAITGPQASGIAETASAASATEGEMAQVATDAPPAPQDLPQQVQSLLAALDFSPVHAVQSLSVDQLPVLGSEENTRLINDINKLLDALEQHGDEWRKVLDKLV